MELTIDISGWTQTEKNYLHAAAYALIWQQLGIDAYNLSVKDGVINIPNLIADVSTILSQSNLKNFIITEIANIETARLAALPELQARETEIATSQFKDIKLSAVDAAIDAATNLTQLKTLLKKFVRFVIARS